MCESRAFVLGKNNELEKIMDNVESKLADKNKGARTHFYNI